MSQLLSSVFFVTIFISTKFIRGDEYPPRDLLEMLQPIHEYCVKEIGVSEDVLKDYDITNKDREVMCYMACIMKQYNWMTFEGEIKYDFIINNPWEPIRDIIVSNVNKCRDVEHSDDECVMIYNFAKCIHDVDVEHWFLP